MLDRSIKKQSVHQFQTWLPPILELFDQTATLSSYETARDNAIVKCIWAEIREIRNGNLEFNGDPNLEDLSCISQISCQQIVQSKVNASLTEKLRK